MAKLIHTMVRVLDLERSLRFYRDALGLDEVHRLDFPTFALVYLRNRENDFEVELTLPTTTPAAWLEISAASTGFAPAANASTNVAIASPFAPERATFVAPMLPEPVCRMSCLRKMRTRM